MNAYECKIQELKAENDRHKKTIDLLNKEIFRLQTKNDHFRKEFQHQEEFNINLMRQLLDKTSKEEVLRKAIEEALELLQAPGPSIDDVEIIQTLRNALPNEPTINKKTFNRIVKETIEEAEAQERKEGE